MAGSSMDLWATNAQNPSWWAGNTSAGAVGSDPTVISEAIALPTSVDPTYGAGVVGYDSQGNAVVGYDSAGNPIIGYDSYNNPIYSPDVTRVGTGAVGTVVSPSATTAVGGVPLVASAPAAATTSSSAVWYIAIAVAAIIGIIILYKWLKGPSQPQVVYASPAPTNNGS